MRQYDDQTQKWIQLIESGRAYSELHSRKFNIFSGESKDNGFVKLILSHCTQEDEILEAGCGAAYTSYALSEFGYNVTALDISEKLIRRHQSIRDGMENQTDLNIEFIVGDIFQLNKLNRKYDIIFNHGVFEHWLLPGEREQLLDSIVSVLSHKGKFIVAVPNLKNPLCKAAISKHDVPLMSTFTVSKLKKELIDRGFSILESGFLFVNPGFEQWVKHRWMIYLIYFIEKVYDRFPKILQKVFSAHIFCVGQLKDL